LTDQLQLHRQVRPPASSLCRAALTAVERKPSAPGRQILPPTEGSKGGMTEHTSSAHDHFLLPLMPMLAHRTLVKTQCTCWSTAPSEATALLSIALRHIQQPSSRLQLDRLVGPVFGLHKPKDLSSPTLLRRCRARNSYSTGGQNLI
jgi:hypothetical protein